MDEIIIFFFLVGNDAIFIDLSTLGISLFRVDMSVIYNNNTFSHKFFHKYIFHLV